MADGPRPDFFTDEIGRFPKTDVFGELNQAHTFACAPSKKNSLKKWMNPRALSLLATDGHGMGPSLCPADGNGLRLDVLGGPKLLLSDGRGVRTEAGRHRVRSWRVRLPP